MVIKKKILAIPHIGTAFGHFYRMATLLDNFANEFNIFILIPEPFINYCKSFLHSEIKIIPRKVHCSISGSSGLIDKVGYKSLLIENEDIYKAVQPELIIGDPGIQASILATKFRKPWIGIMHGCYLPFPNNLILNELDYTLLKEVWLALNKQMNELISFGTNQVYSSWQELQKTGKIIIPNLIYNEPSPIGEYLDLNKSVNSVWDTHNEVDILITCCSAGTVSPSKDFLSQLSMQTNKKIFIAGVEGSPNHQNIIYLGNNVNYRYLVNEKTVVITHGGHGTLQAIGNAKKVFMVPSDFDQLYNSIIASSIKGWQLVFDKNWFEILQTGVLFKREIQWENLSFISNNGDIELTGIEIILQNSVNSLSI